MVHVLQSTTAARNAKSMSKGIAIVRQRKNMLSYLVR